VKPKFSVAIPAYNCSAFLNATLDAVLSQSFPADEVIVVDDGSTDQTSRVIEDYGSFIIVIKIENSGPGAARMRAIAECRNEWIALCDSDDIWSCEYLARKAHAIQSFPSANVFASNFRSFGPSSDNRDSRLDTAGRDWIERYTSPANDNFRLVNDAYRALLDFNPLYPTGLVLSSVIYNLVGGINPFYSRWVAEDSEFTRRLVAHEEARLVIDKEVTWKYRRHEDNYSKEQWKNIYGRARILQEHLKNKVVPPDFIHDTQRTAEDALGKAFDIAYWAKQYSDSLAVYSELPPSQLNYKRRIRHVFAVCQHSCRVHLRGEL